MILAYGMPGGFVAAHVAERTGCSDATALRIADESKPAHDAEPNAQSILEWINEATRLVQTRGL